MLSAGGFREEGKASIEFFANASIVLDLCISLHVFACLCNLAVQYIQDPVREWCQARCSATHVAWHNLGSLALVCQISRAVIGSCAVQT